MELWGRLHLDLAMQEKYLPNGIEIKLRLNRASPRFCFLSDEPCVVKIDEAAIQIITSDLVCPSIKLWEINFRTVSSCGHGTKAVIKTHKSINE